MEKKNNSLVIILIGVIIVILAVFCVLFATGTIVLKSNESSSNNEVNNQEVENQNDNINDEENQNNDSYSINNVEFDYKNDKEVEINVDFKDDYNPDKVFSQKLSIDSNNNLVATKKNTNETYTIKNIKDVKNVMLMPYGTDSAAVKYVILLNNGTVYYSKNLNEISNIEEFESIFTKFEKIENLKVNEIGIAHSHLFPIGKFLAIKTDSDKQYIYEFYDNKLFEVK